MSDTDLNPPDWVTVEQDASELEPPDGPSYRWEFLPDPYPELPHFGVLYLSVPRAASLMVADLHQRGRYPFSTLNARRLSAPQLEKQETKLRSQLTEQIQEHILEAIAGSRLKAVVKPGNIKEFLNKGDGSFAAERTFIFYGDLLEWLARSGYADKVLLVDRPAFEEYEDSEIALAKEIERLVRVRRELQGYDESELKVPKEYSSALEFGDGPGNDLEEQLSYVLEENRALKEQLNSRGDSPVERRLHRKEQNSMLIILAALLELRGSKGRDKELVPSIQRAAERMDHALSANTIRKWLGEAAGLIPRARLKTKSSIEA
jgi:hypothetical protein